MYRGLKCKIVNITNNIDKETREDRFYPELINKNIIVDFLEINCRMSMHFVNDDRTITTSRVNEAVIKDKTIIVKTKNSIYTLERID